MTFTYLFFQKIRLLNSQGVFPLKLLKKISGSFYRCLIFKVRRSLSSSLVRGSLLYITLPCLSSTFFKLFSLFPKSFLKALFSYLPLAECPDIIPKLPPLVNPLFWFFSNFFCLSKYWGDFVFFGHILCRHFFSLDILNKKGKSNIITAFSEVYIWKWQNVLR